MRSLPLLLAALTLPGCLTTHTMSRAVERSSRGVTTVVDEAQDRLVVQELSLGGDQLELAVSAARRELEVERFEITETTSEGHAWREGGRAGRNALWALSAVAGWLGAFGVSWENADGRTVQIGGLGGEATPWQGATALGLALGGLGYGLQQTVATHRSTAGDPRALGTEDVLVRSRDVAQAPLAGQALAFGRGLGVTTDAAGHASLPALQLPLFAGAVDVRTADGAARGLWQPGDGLRESLLALPADWTSPFHSSLAGALAATARIVQEGGAPSPSPSPSAQLTTPEAVQAALAELPADRQARQAAAWLDDLAPYAQAARDQRARIHLDWLRTSARMARQAASTVGVGLMMDPTQSGNLLAPLFQPFDLFHQLPHQVRVFPDELGEPAPAARGPRVALLVAAACDVAAGAQPTGRTLLVCRGEHDEEHRVLVVAGQDLHLASARAWVLAGLLAEPVSQAGARTWLPIVVPLYAASIFEDADAQVGFVQVLDEERLVASGVLGEIGG
ncbi:MAG: hypothetical protein ABIO70_16760 [Pseudomonadota bacterium]